MQGPSPLPPQENVFGTADELTAVNAGVSRKKVGHNHRQGNEYAVFDPKELNPHKNTGQRRIGGTGKNSTQ